MMGGGFGGCTINLVIEKEIESLVYDISNFYKEKVGKDLVVYICKIESGTSKVNDDIIF